MKGNRVHQLALTYDQYKRMGKTISNSQIGDYVVYEELGMGNFGAVYKGMNDLTKNVVAIKVLDLMAIQLQKSQKIKAIRKRLCQTQSKLMMMCDSNNLVKCYDVFENKSLKLMVIQYCNGGTLQDQIQRKGKIPEDEAILILKQIINGLAELHSHKIVHRDLKAQNILSHNGVYKIADFGFSKQIQEQKEVKMTTLGTMITMAPEVLAKQPYGLKADIWSLGIIFFQMIFGRLPYNSTRANDMIKQIKSKKLLDKQALIFNGHTASQKVTSFLEQVLVVDTHKRLNWVQLTNHPLFKKGQNPLSNQFRVDASLQIPKQVDKYQNECNTGAFQQLLLTRFEAQQAKKETKHLVSLSVYEANLKKKELKTNQDKLYQWVKQTHLQCLKTQLIYQQIVTVIQNKKLLDFKEREAVQYIYLLTTRCMNNISVINDRMVRQKNQYILLNLYNTVKQLYEKVQRTWKSYSDRLTKIEDQPLNIIKDRFMKIFTCQNFKKKDLFLVGIQNSEYSKQDQIIYTDQYYKENILKHLKISCSTDAKIKRYLAFYREIMTIKLQDLKGKPFIQHVEMIIG